MLHDQDRDLRGIWLIGTDVLQSLDRTGGGGEPLAPRRSGVGMWLIPALRAEVILGLLLVLRHRAFRLTGLLVLIVAVFAAIGIRDRGATHAISVVLLAGGSLIAVAGSRLLAPGPALVAARWVSEPWWVVPAGRLTGALLVVMPVALATLIAVSAPVLHPVALMRVTLVAAAYVSALGAFTAALSPLVGASAAASCGFLAAWVGGVPPSTIAVGLHEWVYVQRPLVWIWNGLPLMWRARRWLAGEQIVDMGMFLAWIVLGIVGAAWVTGASVRWADTGVEPTP